LVAAILVGGSHYGLGWWQPSWLVAAIMVGGMVVAPTN